MERKKVVNDLLHPFKPSFSNWFIFASVLLRTSLCTMTEREKNNLRNKTSKQASKRICLRIYLQFFLSSFSFYFSSFGVHDGLTWELRSKKAEKTRCKKSLVVSFDFEGWRGEKRDGFYSCVKSRPHKYNEGFKWRAMTV